MPDNEETKPNTVPFDFSAYPADTLFYDRREGQERRHRQDALAKTEPVALPSKPKERREKKERRRRVDPTTFDKNYSDSEIEFMNAMQSFKDQTGKQFPAYGEVLQVAQRLGYRKVERGPGDLDTPRVVTWRGQVVAPRNGP